VSPAHNNPYSHRRRQRREPYYKFNILTFVAGIFDERSHPLVRRVTYTAETATAYIVYRLVFEVAPSPELSPSQLMNMWSLNVLPLYQYLTIQRIRTYAHETLDWVQDGFETFVTQLICNMAYFNRLFSGSDNGLDCECDTVGCCTEDMVCDEIPAGTVDVDVEEYGEYGLETELVTRGNNRVLDPRLADGQKFKFVGRVVRFSDWALKLKKIFPNMNHRVPQLDKFALTSEPSTLKNPML
jgi:hypothetical protein